MNIRQLQYFVSVYNQRSFKATAEYYSVTPQCISKMIKSLEDGINEKLFVRKGIMEKHPDINLKILEMTNDEAITRLRKKECDFASK